MALAHDLPVQWAAVPLEGAQNPACLVYDAPVDPTVHYSVEVPAKTNELRIAVEKARTETCMRFELVDPEGVPRRAPARDAAPEGTQSYSAETILADPMAGTWRIEVFAEGPAVDLRFRALARTIPAPEPEADVILLPDLRPAPPWELTLDLGDACGGCLPSLPGGPLSCGPDETVQNGDLSPCLRFSFATSNIGQGRFELHFSDIAVPGNVREATQWMYAPSGDHQERPAGHVMLHTSHGHYHWAEAYEIRLDRLEPDGGVTEIGLAFKRSACMYDYLIGDWSSFNQWPVGSADASNGCYGVPVGAEPPGVHEQEWIGLSPGWGDVYWWTLADNYVKFDGQDGTYVLHFEVDPQGLLLEANEENNESYILFEVAGQQISVVERGYGKGPEDPARATVAAPWIT